MIDHDRRKLLLGSLSAVALGLPELGFAGAREVDASIVGRSARTAAAALLESLSPALRSRLLLDLHDRNRIEWHYLPTLVEGVPDALRGGFHARRGLSLGEMSDAQRGLAFELLRTVLDVRGWETVAAIMAREAVVREQEQERGTASGFRARLGAELHARVRDPSLYFLAVFGEPADATPWSLRFEGHHLSVHATFVPGAAPAVTPLFLGAFPAVLDGRAGENPRVLNVEMDAIAEVVGSLDVDQLTAATLAGGVPADILAGPHATLDLHRPVGLSVAQMTGAQHELLWRLIEAYARNFRPDATAAELRRVRRSGLESHRVVWAGSTTPGSAHYFRLHGPRLLIEYENAQNGANHVHTVYRDPRNDFGSDDLRRHWRDAH